MTKPNVLIVGAGPAGLTMAALISQHKRFEYHLVDKEGLPGGAYRHLHPKITLASPTDLTKLPGPVDVVSDPYVTIGQYKDYLTRYAKHFELEIERVCVKHISRAQNQWWMTDEDDTQHGPYDAIIGATGMVDFPQQPELPTQTPPTFDILHSRQWSGPQPHWHRVIIVGAGTSAVELAESCATKGIEVIMSTRRKKVKTAPKNLLGRDLHYYLGPLEKLPRIAFLHYCRTYPTVLATDLGFWTHVKAGLITIKGQIESMDGKHVKIKKEKQIQPDAVIFATGFTYKTEYLPMEVARFKHAPKTTSRGESTSHPGLFFIGMPCAQGIASEFLRGLQKDGPALLATLDRLLMT